MHGNLTPEEGAIFGRHCQYLEGLFAEKVVLQAGTSFDPDESDGFALVILAAANKKAARDFIDNDPAVAAGLLLARVTKYDVFLDHGIPS